MNDLNLYVDCLATELILDVDFFNNAYCFVILRIDGAVIRISMNFDKNSVSGVWKNLLQKSVKKQVLMDHKTTSKLFLDSALCFSFNLSIFCCFQLKSFF